MKKLLLGLTLLTFSAPILAQSAIVRGEASPGVYETIKSTSQALDVNVKSTTNTANSAAWAHTAPTVTNASTTILAALAVRKAVIIQNNHATGIVYLNLAGGTATTAMLALLPGQSMTLTAGVPVTAITAIGSIASNAAVAVVEGQ